MNCKYCGAELEEGCAKCPSCGAEVERLETEQVTAEQPEVEQVDAAPEAVEQAKAEQAQEAPEESAPVETASEAETVPEKGLSAGKIALLAVLGVAAIAVVIALIMGGINGAQKPEETTPETTASTAPAETTQPTIPDDGNPDDATCKGTYTAEGEALTSALDTVVATMDGKELTNGELQIYYWMQFYDFMDQYGSYASLFGLNINQSLDTQTSMDGTMTWQQFFLQSALTNWSTYQALCLEAEAQGFELEDIYREYLDNLEDTLNASAAESGMESAEAVIQSDMGPGASLESYKAFMEKYYTGFSYYQSQVNAIQISDEEIDAYFTEHAEDYESNGLDKETKFIDVRHILIRPEGGTIDESGNTTYSDEEWEAARVKAQEILDEYLAGEQTEERFAELANANSQDPGSNTNGGLYTNVYEDQMVPEFNDWCFDESRVSGDTGLVRCDSTGYHVIFFVNSKLAWIETARNDVLAERAEALINEAKEAHPINTDYSAIVLGNVDFNTAG